MEKLAYVPNFSLAVLHTSIAFLICNGKIHILLTFDTYTYKALLLSAIWYIRLPSLIIVSLLTATKISFFITWCQNINLVSNIQFSIPKSITYFTYFNSVIQAFNISIYLTQNIYSHTTIYLSTVYDTPLSILYPLYSIYYSHTLYNTPSIYYIPFYSNQYLITVYNTPLPILHPLPFIQ